MNVQVYEYAGSGGTRRADAGVRDDVVRLPFARYTGGRTGVAGREKIVGQALGLRLRDAGPVR